MQINAPLSKIIDVVRGEVTLDHSFFVENISALESAGFRDIAIVFDPEENGVFDPISLEKIKSSRAGVIISSKPYVSDKSWLIVSNPLEAYQKLVTFLEKERAKKHEIEIHPSAVVDRTAALGDDVLVGPCAVIGAGARVGEGTLIGAHSYIGSDCIIGVHVTIHPQVTILDRCIIGDYSIIHPGAVIGGDGYRYIASKNGLEKVPQIGIVRIGKHVEIGANTCIDRASFDETIIEDGVKLDNLVHIAHNVQVGAHTAIIAQTGIAGGTRIGAGCQIGGQVAIKDHITIGKGVRIVSKSAVLKDVAAGETVCGIPAISFSEWKRMIVYFSKLSTWAATINKLEKFLESSAQQNIWNRWFNKKK